MAPYSSWGSLLVPYKSPPLEVLHWAAGVTQDDSVAPLAVLTVLTVLTVLPPSLPYVYTGDEQLLPCVYTGDEQLLPGPA